MRILIIEDDPLWSKRLIKLADSAGFTYDLVENWTRAFSLVKSGEYFGILSDLSLLGDSESGLQTLALMESFKPPKTIVITTYLDPRLYERCISISFVEEAITKPDFEYHFDLLNKFFEGKLSKSVYLQQEDDLEMEEGSKRNVFVVHGRNEDVRQEMFSFLRSLDLNPIEWSEAIHYSGAGSPFIGDVLDAAFRRARVVIVLLTPDDEVRLKKDFLKKNDHDFEGRLTGQARPNVLFEAGLAFGHKPERTVLVEIGQTRPFSDVAGRNTIRFKDTPASRNELAARLETAGCVVKRKGSDWLNAGKF